MWKKIDSYQSIVKNYPFTFVLAAFFCFLIIKYVSNKVRRNPRLVTFSAALPGPPVFPIIGSNIEFFVAGMSMYTTSSTQPHRGC